jgi:hypothetical protein
MGKIRFATLIVGCALALAQMSDARASEAQFQFADAQNSTLFGVIQCPDVFYDATLVLRESHLQARDVLLIDRRKAAFEKTVDACPYEITHTENNDAIIYDLYLSRTRIEALPATAPANEIGFTTCNYRSRNPSEETTLALNCKVHVLSSALAKPLTD